MNLKLIHKNIYTTLLVLAVLLFAAAGASGAAMYDSIRGLALSQGLSDLLVNVIYKDSRGYVWFGTEKAIDRFDGNAIVSYAIPGDSRQSRRVKSIKENESGALYVGTAQGLYYLKAGADGFVQIAPKDISFSVNDIEPNGRGQIYLATRHGLFILDEKSGKTEHRLLVNDSMSEENEILALDLDEEEGLWIVTPHKIWLMSFRNNDINEYLLPTSAHATRVAEMKDMLFVGTEGAGVIPFDKRSRGFGETISLGNGLITSLSSTPNGNFAASTDGEGIFVYSPERHEVIRHLTTKDGLRSNAVYSTMVDPNGLLWVGYYQSGVDYSPLTQRIVTPYAPSGIPDLAGTLVRALAVDGDVWAVGTHDGLYIADQKTGAARRFDKEQLGSNQIFSIKALNGKFYVGTYHGGIHLIDPSTMTLRRFGPAALNDETVFIIETDPEGNLWVGTSAGVYRFDGARESDAKIYSSATSQLPEGNVYEIFFDSTGRGWFCTENGLALWNGSQLRATGFPAGFINKMKIRVVYESPSHTLYFAPDRGRIWKSDLALSQFSQLTLHDESRFTMATAITEDKDGHLWIGTDKGLVGISGKDQYVIINNVGGVVNPTYTLSEPYVDEAGNIWLGSATGLHKIDAQQARAAFRRGANRIEISNLKSNNRSIIGRLEAPKNQPLRISLSASEPDLAISVTDFGFRPPEYFEAEYMCEGIDSDWRTIDGTQDIRYFDIQPGDYTLKVREPGNPLSEVSIAIHKSGGFNWALFSLVIVIIGVVVTAWLGAMLVVRRRKESRQANADAGDSATSSQADDDKKDRPYRTTSLSDEECKRLLRKLETLMKEDKPYTNPDLKSVELARMIGTTSHSLSFLFNQYLRTSYYDYVNKYRVDEFKRLVADTDTSKYTLSAMAERCGFSSRATFFRHFKAHTGLTPAEYLKGLENAK